MSEASPRPPVIHMIWTRQLDGQPMAGRLRVAHAVRQVLTDAAAVHQYVMTPKLDGKFSSLLSSLAAVASNLLKGRLLPLQCALYASPREVSRAVASIDPDADVIYLDGVRTIAVIEAVRKRYPQKRIVVDFDDLMSRRMQLLRRVGQPLSPGYLMQRLPPLLVRILLGPLGKLLSWYEAMALPRIEADICHLADAVVLLSKADMALLPQGGKAERYTIPPTVEISGKTPWPQPGPLRFAFIGTDALTQNRLTIDYLLDLWTRHRLDSPLSIFGIQHRGLTLPSAVTVHGYVDSIDEIYDGHTLLLTPTFLAGGIKTKVLEGFAYRAPVIGNALTFESMSFTGYPLQIDDEAELVAFLKAPEEQRGRVDAALAFALDYIRTHHAEEGFATQWLKAAGIERHQTRNQEQAHES